MVNRVSETLRIIRKILKKGTPLEDKKALFYD
jgi:hypothetical protein